jgi:hypothetical protein
MIDGVLLDGRHDSHLSATPATSGRERGNDGHARHRREAGHPDDGAPPEVATERAHRRAASWATSERTACPACRTLEVLEGARQLTWEASLCTREEPSARTEGAGSAWWSACERRAADRERGPWRRATTPGSGQPQTVGRRTRRGTRHVVGQIVGQVAGTEADQKGVEVVGRRRRGHTGQQRLDPALLVSGNAALLAMGQVGEDAFTGVVVEFAVDECG